ncbi:major facilitator superfamily domain-containing protein [Bombardia bombarda]|uniref:Major facilitator superfamily domain-containing protein n=1 Tax=Bombardia bombarda TaxID=252184 RepID=A0AA39XL20_9PEZI|nr:major facilitator superfamily domain-containing protein [Bombardia bombarda]
MTLDTIQESRRLIGAHGDDDSFSTTATAAENTPQLRSETASSYTARDGSPDGTDDHREHGVDSPLLGSSAAAAAAVEQPPPLTRARAICIILSMWALIFLQASNMSGISTTQSTIAADLDAYEHAMWFTSSYLITMSSVAPLIGRLAMVFSPGALIMVLSSFFSVGALVTSQARSLAVLITGRVLVGIGGGGIMALSLILVIQLTSKRRRGLWIGIANAGFTIGLSTGAVVYGALLPVIGWRALFWLQCPMGVFAGLGVYFSLPASLHDDMRTKGLKEQTTLQKLAGLDYAGAFTLTTTILLFLYALSSTIRPVPLLLSLLSLVLFILIESTPLPFISQTDPIIPVIVLRSRGILLSCFSQLGFMAARWTILFYAPVFVLAVRGLSPAAAGSVLIPTNLGFGTGGLLVGWLHVRRAGAFWLPSLIALALFGAALFALSFLSTAAASAPAYVAVIFINGLCTGAALNYTLAHLLHLASPEVHFIATGLLSTFRGFAGSFGTTIGGGVFARTLRASLADGFAALDGSGDGVSSKAREKMITILIGSPAAVWQDGFLSAAERRIAVGGYEAALTTLYRSAAALCVLVLLVQAGTGWADPPEKTREEEEEIAEEIAEHDARMEA